MTGSPIRKAIFEQGIFGRGTEPLPEQGEWMRRLGTPPLVQQPGGQWQYHLSHDVLGVLVARVPGQPCETFLRERILEPLGTKDTGFHVSAGKVIRLPPSYVPYGTRRWADSTASLRRRRLQRLLPDAADHGTHGIERILSRPAVELMTTNRLTPGQPAVREALARNNVHVSFSQGQHGGWGFGMAVRGTGTPTYADPDHQLTGILLTQVGMPHRFGVAYPRLRGLVRTAPRRAAGMRARHMVTVLYSM